MTVSSSLNSYEEARKKRLEENKRIFEGLGIWKLNEDLSSLMKPQVNSHQHRIKLYRYKCYNIGKPRRSTRERKPIDSYAEEGLKKRLKLNSSGTRYLQNPLHENSFAACAEEERVQTIKHAEDLQTYLRHPSFIKSMARSQVGPSFLLNVPTRFGDDHLPKTVLIVVLEDENKAEYKMTYNGSNKFLTGGWKAFALAHELDYGDALVFELIQPARFKVYIIKVSQLSSGGGNVDADGDNHVNKVKEDLAVNKSSLECGTNHAPAKVVANTADKKIFNLPRRGKRLLR